MKMILQPIRCIYCHGTDIVKFGKTSEGKQRYRCREDICNGRTFILDYSHPGRLRSVKQQITDMALNGSGVRNTARVLHVSPNTVTRELKKRISVAASELIGIKATDPEQVKVEIQLAPLSEGLDSHEPEIDEMWSYVANKSAPHWLWYAIGHQSGRVLAYVFGERRDEVFLKLKALLEPFGITRFYTDGWGAYERHLEAEKHVVGKQNTQKIENKNLNLRMRIKRLARRTICFSKSILMHNVVIGLFINRYEFGLAV
jgi:IS1 family transposase/transposase-like protein